MRKDGSSNNGDNRHTLSLCVRIQGKLESTIDAYKIKLEEMSDLRQQIKYLEENNLRLFDEKSNLEQEYKQAKLLQTQVEFHKRTNQELYQKISELQRLADKAEFERSRAEERFNAVNAEKLVRIELGVQQLHAGLCFLEFNQ